MYKVTLLDEAAVRTLSLPELSLRNFKVQFELLPVKKDADYVRVTAFNLREAKRLSLPEDSGIRGATSGQTTFDLSSATDCQLMASMIWAYIGLSPSRIDLQREFLDAAVPPMGRNRASHICAESVISWYAKAKDHPTPPPQLWDEPDGNKSFSWRQLEEMQSKGKPLLHRELQANCAGMVVDYERTSKAGAENPSGVITVLHHGRQHLFEGVRWQSNPTRITKEESDFLRDLSRLTGLRSKDRVRLTPFLRDRFRAMASERQATYDLGKDIERYGQLCDNAKRVITAAELTEMGPNDYLISVGDFLDRHSGVRPAHDERGELQPAAAPAYKASSDLGDLHQTLD